MSERKPIRFNTPNHGQLKLSGMRVQYKVEDDGYYYFVDEGKLIEIIENQQNTIIRLERALKEARPKEEKKIFVPTARNSEQWQS